MQKVKHMAKRLKEAKAGFSDSEFLKACAALTGEAEEDSKRDRAFKTILMPYTSLGTGFATELRETVEKTEKRTRARKDKDQETFIRQVECMTANLIHRYLSQTEEEAEEDNEGWIHVSQSKTAKSIYSAPVMGKTLPKLIKTLAALGLIDYINGTKSSNPAKRRQTTIRASETLIERIDNYGLTINDLCDQGEGQVIILKSARVDHWGSPKRIEYPDTVETIQHRERVRRIHDNLVHADIAFNGLSEKGVVPVHMRRLLRIFNNGSFRHGGRLFGGFWQGLKKHERKRIRINGSPVKTIDYGQIGPRIMYGMANVTIRFDDAYEVPGFTSKERDGIKKVFNAMCYASKRPEKFPRETKDLFPKGTKVGSVVDAILKAHSPIAHMFFSGQGLQAMFMESEILLSVLDTLMECNILGLPIHDAIVVEESYSTQVRDIMEATFKESMDIHIPVSIEDD